MCSCVSNISTQFLGIFIFILIITLLIRGLLICLKLSKPLPHQKFWISIFIILGPMLLNIISTYPLFQKVFHILNLNYYAGGYLGYAISKIVFIDILKQTSLYWWHFFIILCVWIWSLQYICLFSYSILYKPAKIKKLFSFKNIKPIILNIKSKFYNRPDGPQRSLYKARSACIMQRDTNQLRTMTQDDYLINNETKQINTMQNTISDYLYDSRNEQPQYSNSIHEYFHKNKQKTSTIFDCYKLPNISLLDEYTSEDRYIDQSTIQEISNELLQVLEEFSVKGKILNVRQGPVVTIFEFKPVPGIKTSRVISLSEDIARSMSVISVRISTIPGQNAIGIELPNKQRQTVYLSELLISEVFQSKNNGIPLILGKDINGLPVLADLVKMPHLLMAGTTGSGKSVSINGMILSILFKFKPTECKLIMIDPKMLELSVYDNIPHLLTPVVTEPKQAVFALKWAVSEMEHRYKQMSKLGVRNIDNFNQKLKDAQNNPQLLIRKIQTGFDPNTGKPIFETQHLDFDPIPYIVVVVDEMADLMLVAGKEVEASIQRLAQMARAAGIHLIMATQRPSVDVVTGTIKANFPTRISFQVTSKIDSRTILGEQGAEQLLGQGDMLYMSGAGRILRVHGPFVKDSEVERVVNFIRNQGVPDYVDIITEQSDESNSNKEQNKNSEDDMYNRALEIIMNDKKCSVSYIQRKLQIGYNRAARIIEEMEEKGVLSPPNNNGKREILI